MSRRRMRLVIEGSDEAGGGSGPEEVLVTASADGRTYRVERGGAVVSGDLAVLPDGRLSFVGEDGRQVCARVATDADGATLSTPRGARRVPISDPRLHRGGASDTHDPDGPEEIRALMPGRVLEVFAREGEPVAAGAVLLVLEAMKMQNEIRASRAGRVARVAVTPKQAVDGGALMVVLEAPGPVPPPAP